MASSCSLAVVCCNIPPHMRICCNSHSYCCASRPWHTTMTCLTMLGTSGPNIGCNPNTGPLCAAIMAASGFCLVLVISTNTQSTGKCVSLDMILSVNLMGTATNTKPASLRIVSAFGQSFCSSNSTEYPLRLNISTKILPNAPAPPITTIF